MTKAEQALLAQTIEQMKTDFEAALKAALAPHVEQINALLQRSENFAARVSAHRVMTTERIRALEAQVAALTPVKKVAAAKPLTRPEWNRAHASMCAKFPGTTFFKTPDVYHEHTLLCQLDATAQACRDEDTATLREHVEDEEVSL